MLLLGTMSGSFLTACDSFFSSTNHKATPQATKIDQRGLLTPGVLQWGATSSHNAPFLYHSSNHLIGFEFDIVNAITHLIGITQEHIETDYSQLDQALQAGQYDVIVNGWTSDPQNSAIELFSQAYYRSGQQIVVRADDVHFKNKTTADDLSLLDLQGFTVGALTGHDADLIAADSAIHLRLYDDALLFDDLLVGRIDAVFASFPTVAYHVLGYGIDAHANTTLKLIGQPFEFCDYVIAYNKNSASSPTLQKEIDQAITALKNNGSLATICKKWGLWNTTQTQISTHL